MADCVDIEVRNRELCIRFPGGSRICASPPGIVGPTEDELAQILMAQVSPALAPLQPIFDLIGALVAVKDFAEAVPQILVDPSALVEATADLVEKVTSLAAILPPLSVPVLIVDLITTLLKYLEGTLAQLQLLVEQQERINAARETAVEEELSELLAGVECAEQQLEGLLESLQDGAGPINNLLEVINAVASLAGLPEIAPFSISGTISESVEAIEGLVETLTAARDAIPL